jgi:hypothetical protein
MAKAPAVACGNADYDGQFQGSWNQVVYDRLATVLRRT